MTTPTKTSSFRPDIQGLRAIAVLLVVLYHSGVSVLGGGYVGVDVFFVISGFLITSHLLGSLERDGRIRFREFYAKRARRILPASFAVVLFTVIASFIWVNPLQLTQVLQGAAWTALYVPNYLFAVEGTDYLAETIPSVFQHYWSLGIEEQFYILWPALLTGAFLLLRRRPKLVTWVILAVAVVSFAACLLVVSRSQPWAFFSLPTRAWELAVGGLVAALLRTRPAWIATGIAGLSAWVGLIAVIAAGFTFTSSTPFPGLSTLLPVLGTAALIIGGASSTRWSPAPLLSLRPMQFVGAISYSLYLVHWPMQQIPQSAVGYNNPLPLWVTLGLAALSVPLAWLSFRYIEEPFRTSPRARRASASATLIATGATSAVIAVAAICLLLVSNLSPISSGRAVEAGQTLSVPPVVPSFVPSNLTPQLREASNDNSVVYANGCHQGPTGRDANGCWFGSNTDAPVVALFGDSHAASWVPAFAAMAEAGEIRLNSNSKSSCGSIQTASEQAEPGTSCAVWRDRVIERLRTDPPAVIVLANFAAARVEGESDPAQAWREGIAQTLAELPAASRVVIMADSPNFGITPAMCLAAHVEDVSACEVDRAVALRNDLRSVERDTAGADWIDLTDHICDDLSCSPVVGNYLVSRDAHHLTKTFAEALTPALREHLLSALSTPRGT